MAIFVSLTSNLVLYILVEQPQSPYPFFVEIFEPIQERFCYCRHLIISKLSGLCNHLSTNTLP